MLLRIFPLKMYHEKQTLAHCAIHTLNNLFQYKYMTYNKMKNISNKLYLEDKENGLIKECSLNPYNSTLPYLGYFDIACIIKGLDENNCEIIEHINNIKDILNLNLIKQESESEERKEENGEVKSNNIESNSPSSSSSSPQLISSKFVGLIINEMNSSFFGLWNSRHWYCIIYHKESGIFFNLDSNLDSPEIIGNENELKQFLKNLIQQNQAQVFVVSRKS